MINTWVAVTDALPKPLQTVWLTNGKGWVCLGCLVESDDGWHLAEGNGVIYIENGEIVSECESEDMIHEPKKLTEALDIVLNEVKKFRLCAGRIISTKINLKTK